MGDIKGFVRHLIRTYRTNNPFSIAEQRGIVVLPAKLKGILGFHQTYKRISVISIQQDLPDEERRFVCAHELGHAFLHPRVNTPFLRQNTLFSIDKIEREANKFAVELLVPDEELFMGDAAVSCMTVREASQTYGVPYELMSLKRLN